VNEQSIGADAGLSGVSILGDDRAFGRGIEVGVVEDDKRRLPPSSSEIFLTVEATCFMSARPTSVEPVNETLRTMGFVVISSPIARASPVTTLSTPGRKPARDASSASASAENGVAPAGLMMTVQPAASAGETLRVIIEDGKFHGVIAAQTPTGCLITMSRRSLPMVGITSP
jgi:hypothetical protein